MQPYDGFDPEVGEITALRTFRIGPGGQLFPLFGDVAWTEGVNTAVCRVRTSEPDRATAEARHIPPDPDCTCGFYAYATPQAAGEYPYARHVLAVVTCWGYTIAGTRGLRTQHARIDALWMSDGVPSELATSVASTYPTTTIYSDKTTMLNEHPPTVLDCYETAATTHQRSATLGLRIAIFLALAVGCLPAHWIWAHHEARLLWAAELFFFLAGAAMIRLTRRNLQSRGAGLLFVAVTLWLVAPFAGPAGTILLRLPILQITGLGYLLRARLNRLASTFPAHIRPAGRTRG